MKTHIKKHRYERWTVRRSFSWTTWTFGFWGSDIGRKRCYGIDLGPVAWTWERRL